LSHTSEGGIADASTRAQLQHRVTASFRGELMRTVIASNLISILGVGSLVIASAKLL